MSSSRSSVGWSLASSASGRTVRSIAVAADAGTAFDRRYSFHIAEDCIQKIDLKTGLVLATIPAPRAG